MLRLLIVLLAVLSAPTYGTGEDSYFAYYCSRALSCVVRPFENWCSGTISNPPDAAQTIDWFNRRLKTLPVKAGTQSTVMIADLPEIVETIDWMIGSCRARLVTNPTSAVLVNKTLNVLVAFRKLTEATGKVDSHELQRITSDFAYAMGHKKIPKYYNVLTNNIAVSPKYVDAELTHAEEAGPYVLWFSTPADLDIRYMNDLTPYPVFPTQVIRERKQVGGDLYYPFSFWGHDLNHGSARYQKLFKPLVDRIQAGDEGALTEYKQLIEKRALFYKDFRSFVDREPDPQTQGIYELAWFLQNFEGFDHYQWKAFQMDRESLSHTLSIPAYPQGSLVADAILREIQENPNWAAQVGGKSNLSKEQIETALRKLKSFCDTPQ